MRRAPVLLAIAASCAFAGVAAGDVSPGPTTASPDALAAQCATAPCRTVPYRVSLQAQDGANHYEITFQPQPYVQNGAIVILPGETLIFRVPEESGEPGTPAFVSARIDAAPTKVLPSDASFQGDSKTTVQHDPKTGENFYVIKKGSPYDEGKTAAEDLKDAPPGTVIVSYHQAVGRADMILRIEHNLSRPIKYDALIAPPAPDGISRPSPTSTCPVKPLFAMMESWPYPLGAITMRNFRFIDTSNGFNCN